MNIAESSIIIDSFVSRKILLIGDVMLDRYVYGSVSRISPEAPVPVITIEGSESSIGAAANAARNITALGAQVTLVSVVGSDESGYEVIRKIGDDRGINPMISLDSSRKSTVKIRYISGNHQLLRADIEQNNNLNPSLERHIILIMEKEIPRHDVIIMSDYDKGVLTEEVFSAVIACAKKHGKPIIIDPKKANWNIYRGATVVTPNLHEWFVASGKPYNPFLVRELLELCGIENVIVTRSKDGMSLINSVDDPLDIPAAAKLLIDVTGAGDTVVALLALALASGLTLSNAAKMANIAAGVVVGKPRTATVTPGELKHAVAAGIC